MKVKFEFMKFTEHMKREFCTVMQRDAHMVSTSTHSLSQPRLQEI